MRPKTTLFVDEHVFYLSFLFIISCIFPPFEFELRFLCSISGPELGREVVISSMKPKATPELLHLLYTLRHTLQETGFCWLDLLGDPIRGLHKVHSQCHSWLKQMTGFCLMNILGALNFALLALLMGLLMVK